MIRSSQSFLLTWMVTALAAIGAWFFLPGSTADRAVFKQLAGAHPNPSGEIEGQGTHSKPWLLKSETEGTADSHLPGHIALHDNDDNIFQGSPHTPIDLAIVFNNLKRLGTRDFACCVLLAWENPDTIALSALESSLQEFESVTLSAPVTRGAIMESIPPTFRRASIEANQLQGDHSSLPHVNRISIPNLIHGGENTMTGFQVIDSEPDQKRPHLMAKWDDRIIFSFSVVAAMQQLGIKADDLEIVIGGHLRFGKDGPSIAIDSFGRLQLEPEKMAATKEINAEVLIDAEPEDEGLPPLQHALLRDLRSHADLATRDFNQMIPGSIDQLLAGQSLKEEQSFSRISSGFEMALLLCLAFGLSASSLTTRGLQSLICFAALLGSGFGLWIGFGSGLWLPGLPAATTIITAWLCAMLWGKRKRRTTSMPRLERLEFESMQDPN